MRYKKLSIFICFIVLLLLNSCGFFHVRIDWNVEDDTIYSKNPSTSYDNLISEDDIIVSEDILTVGYIEKNYTKYNNFVQTGGSYIKFISISNKGIKYYFEDEKYTGEQIIDFINKIENLCSFLENEAGVLLEEEISIYVSEKNTLQGKSSELFLKDMNIESVKNVAAFLQALFGENSNYGLCYGIGYHINEKLYGNSLEPEIFIDVIGRYYSIEDNIHIMDLTLPVFQPIYFSDKDNYHAYATAYYFIKDLIERKGIEYSLNLLKSSAQMDISFDIDYTAEKNIWLESIGATQKCEALSIPIRYALNVSRKSIEYPYKIYTTSTISYFVPNEVFGFEDITADYKYIKHYLSMYEEDVTALRAHLEPYFDTGKGVITCYFKMKEDGLSFYLDSKYFYKEDSIEYASLLWPGAHEYAHFITYNDSSPLWMIEGMADYCAFYLEDEGVHRMLKEYFSKIVIGDSRFINIYNKNLQDTSSRISVGKGNDINLALYNDIRALINNDIDMDKKSTVEFMRVVKGDDNGSELSYPEAASLVNYLIKTYGEDSCFEVYKDYSKLEEVYGKSYKELKEEWLIYLNNYLEF